MPEKIRFSSVLAETNNELSKLSDEELTPIREAFAANIVGKSFGAGRDGDVADIDEVIAAFPKELRFEGRNLANAFRDETALRGSNWLTRSGVLTLVEGLPVLASTTDGEEAPAVKPTKAKKAGKK